MAGQPRDHEHWQISLSRLMVIVLGCAVLFGLLRQFGLDLVYLVLAATIGGLIGSFTGPSWVERKKNGKPGSERGLSNQ